MFFRSSRGKSTHLGNNYYFVVTVICYAVFLFVFISKVLPYPTLWPSPDGIANLTSAKRLSEGKITLQEIPQILPQPLHQYFIPRSTVYLPNHDAVGLQSFYGLPVFYGLFIKIASLPLLFTFSALIGFVAMYWLCYQATSSRLAAYLGVFLYAFHPLFLYYSIHGLMHNLLFVNLLVLSLATGMYAIKKNVFWIMLVAGILLGWSAAVRMNEMVWVLPTFFILVALLSKQFIRYCMFAIAGFLLVLVPFLSISYSISGSLTQYKSLNETTFTDSEAKASYVQSIFFPAGVDIRSGFASFYHFSMHLWWWMIPFFTLGLLLFIYFIKKRQYKNLSIFIILILSAMYLAVIYGPSGKTYPPDKILIGYSHFRYLLPLFLSAPFLFAFLYSKLKQTNFTRGLLVLLLAIYGISSVLYLINTKTGLQDSRYQNILAFERNKKMHQTVDSKAFLIAGRADKYFFPDWVVAGGSFYKDPDKFAELLLNNRIINPVYFYYIPADINSHNIKKALESKNLRLTYVTMFFEEETLYKIDWPN